MVYIHIFLIVRNNTFEKLTKEGCLWAKITVESAVNHWMMALLISALDAGKPYVMKTMTTCPDIA